MICGHLRKKFIFKCGAISLYRCDDCKFVLTDAGADNIDSKKLYENYYKNETGQAGRFGFGIECIVRLFRFFRAFKVFTVYPRAGTILDIGSGRGFMLYYLKKYYGYRRTAGTQVSRKAFEFSRDRLGLEMYDKDLLELSLGNNVFDIVTMWHVLEHVYEPERYIEKIRDLLAGNGKLIIEVPNFSSWARLLTGRYWLGLDTEYHRYFFDADSLSGLLKKYGFKAQIVHTFSLEYSTFLSAQSIVSLLTKTDHVIFRCLQSGSFRWELIPHLMLFALLAPVCFIINLMLYFSKKGEVLLVVAQREAHPCAQ